MAGILKDKDYFDENAIFNEEEVSFFDVERIKRHTIGAVGIGSRNMLSASGNTFHNMSALQSSPDMHG